MNKSKATYRIIKSSWGIAIDITAEYVKRSTYKRIDELHELSPGLWGRVDCKVIPKTDIKHLWSGLGYISDLILKNSPYNMDTLIIINSVEFNFADYQAEGIIAAIIYWASKAFNFESPDIEVIFNQNENRYIFNFDIGKKKG